MMKNKPIKLTIKAGVICVGLTAFVITTGYAWISRAMTSAEPHGSNVSVMPVQGRNEITVEMNSNGFSPNEIQHSPGTFAIAVDNKALAGEYTLRLSAEDGTVLSELHVQKGSSALSVSLQTGRYTLTEIDHSQWTCRILVQ